MLFNRLMDDNSNKGCPIVHGLEDVVVNNKKDAFAKIERAFDKRRSSAFIDSYSRLVQVLE